MLLFMVSNALQAGSLCSLFQPKSDLSDFGQLRMSNSGKPEFGRERGGVMGYGRSMRGNPLTPTLSPTGRGSAPSSRHRRQSPRGVCALLWIAERSL
jgi:hypothetical protein